MTKEREAKMDCYGFWQILKEKWKGRTWTGKQNYFSFPVSPTSKSLWRLHEKWCENRDQTKDMSVTLFVKS